MAEDLTGTYLREWADIVGDRVDSGDCTIRIFLLHHGAGSDDVTFEIRPIEHLSFEEEARGGVLDRR